MNIFEQHSELITGMSLRSGGVSPEPLGLNLSFSVGDAEENVLKNRALFFASLGLKMDQMAIQGQVHSTNVRVISVPGRYEETDGLITTVPGVILTVSIADCQPVLLYDPVSRTVAGIHSGWRGTRGRILEKALNFMHDECGAQPMNVIAWLGPAAGGCCYEVGEEVASQFDARYVIREPGRKARLDICSANYDMLIKSGLDKNRVECDERCTIHNPELFHSFRREGAKSGRMMAVIGLRA